MRLNKSFLTNVVFLILNLLYFLTIRFAVLLVERFWMRSWWKLRIIF